MEKTMINAYELLAKLKTYRDDDPIDEYDSGFDAGIWKAQQLIKEMLKDERVDRS